MSERKCGILSFIVWLCILYGPAATASGACTFWAAAGERTENNVVLIAKNRDGRPLQSEKLGIVNEGRGYRYLGLFPLENGKKRTVSAGINEKGLAVVSASAGGGTADWREQGGGRGMVGRLLQSCAGVGEVFAKHDWLLSSQPGFYMVGDRNEIAWIEIAPGRQFASRGRRQGVLVHANHYLHEKLAPLNAKTEEGSYRRLQRIQQLLQSYVPPLSMEDFVVFSEDRKGGPDHAIWRSGRDPLGERTLSTWIVALFKNDVPQLYVKIANPDEPEKVSRLSLHPAFWDSGLD
jgi:hypothetical protein